MSADLSPSTIAPDLQSTQVVRDWHIERDAREVIGLLLLSHVDATTLRDIAAAHRAQPDEVSGKIAELLEREIEAR